MSVLVIKELEVQGFKSFAARTKIPFQHSVTAVVGPNGCGKSNILDAIKWVLGEKSVKSIRGEKMEDLIFSGTETQKASSFTQVTLVMDNQKKIFPIDMNEIRISRKMYRDGQSQYFLNDIRVARREIENLLLDTGLGKSSYSFMEQGQMDMILSSKPNDRRQIFEEAAGIARFKNQQEEARKNLDSTNANLVRVTDIQRELERELKTKRIQAEKTEQYNKLKQKHKEHDLRIRYLTIEEVDKSLALLQKKLEGKIAEREKAKQKTLQYEEQITIFEEERSHAQKQLHEKDVTNQLAREKIMRWEADLENFSQRREALKKEIEDLQSRMTKLDQRIKALKKELHNQNQLTLNLDVRIDDAVNRQNKLEQKIKNFDNEIEDNKKNLTEVAERQKDNANHLKKLRSDLETIIQELLLALKREKDKWQQENILRKDKQQQLLSGLKKLDQQLNELITKAKIESNESIVQQLEGYLKEASMQQWLQSIEQAGNLSEGLTHLLLDHDGIHARKEQVDELIVNLEKENESLEHNKNQLQKNSEILKEEKALTVAQKESLLGEIKSFHVTKENVTERENNLKEQMKNDTSHLSYIRDSFDKTQSQLIQMDNEEVSKRKEVEQLQASITKDLNEIDIIEKKIENLEKKKENLNEQIQKENEKNKKIFEETNELEIKIGTHLGLRESLVQDMYNDYNLTIDEIKEQLKHNRINIDNEKEKRNQLQREITSLGAINPLAIDELKSVEEYYNHNQEQINDIKSARAHIEAVIEEIGKKSEQLFLETFGQVQKNFKIIFQKLFNGGNAALTLVEPEQPLASGIEIEAQPKGKKQRSLRLLSGGEKALTAISLLFAIYMVRSSPFCVLDEIDAPLDDQNVIRFLNLLDDFSDKTQFILITHNKKTMAKADALFGVTMDEPGISRLLAVEMKSVQT